MRLLVIGGTGATGQEIVRQAVAAGHTVTAVARDTAKAEKLLPGARVVAGNVLDAVSLERVAEGQEAVISSLGSGLSLFTKMTLLSEGTKNLIAAMTARNVRRLVCITGVGAGDSRGHGGFVYDRLILPTALRQVYADKDRQEAVVRASGLEWVLVRPERLTGGPRTGKYRVLTDMSGVHGGTIARADVADFVVGQASDPSYAGQTPLLVY